MGRARRKWSRPETEEGERRFIFPSFFSNFFKAIQNEILTQFEIRLQTKQYKILCNSMNAHSLLLTLYLVLFLIKLLFPKFKFPQNAKLITFSYFKKYAKFRVLQKRKPCGYRTSTEHTTVHCPTKPAKKHTTDLKEKQV